MGFSEKAERPHQRGRARGAAGGSGCVEAERWALAGPVCFGGVHCGPQTRDRLSEGLGQVLVQPVPAVAFSLC